MTDEDKTREQLLEELEAARRRVVELEGSEAHLKSKAAKHKRQEEARRESEEMHRAITEAALDSIFCKDLDSRYTFVNPAMERVLGRPASELLGLTPRELFDEESAAIVEALDAPVFLGEVANAIRTLDIQGEDRTFHTIQVPQRDAAGEITGLCGFVRDVTEQQRVEEALRESEERYRGIFDTVPTSIILVDKDGQIVDISPHHFDGFAKGATKEDYLGLKIANHPNIVDVGLAEQFTRVLQGDLLQAKDVYFPATTAGRAAYATIRAVPLLRDGQVTGAVFVFEEVTERRQAEDELRESERRFRHIFDLGTDGIIIADDEGRIQMANSTICELLGYRQEELITLRVEDIHDEAGLSEVAEQFRLLAEGKVTVAEDLPLLRRDGTVLSTEVKASVIALGDKLHIMGAFRDITERKQAEEERERLEAQLRHQQKLEAIGTLAGGVAHEINNPIQCIMSFARLISDRLDPESPLREFSEGIGEETERVAKIVRGLLSFARQEKESHSPARIVDIVDDTLSLIRTIMLREQITLEIDVPDDLPTIKCRSQQIQQVLMNLLTNARDALNERYPEYDPDKILAVTVRPFEKEGRPWLRATVEDHGAGIYGEARERLFDPFFTTKDRTKGTGLGLSISYGIVQDHHGDLSVECERDRYTRFHLELPVDNGWSLDEASEEPKGAE